MITEAPTLDSVKLDAATQGIHQQHKVGRRYADRRCGAWALRQQTKGEPSTDAESTGRELRALCPGELRLAPTLHKCGLPQFAMTLGPTRRLSGGGATHACLLCPKIRSIRLPCAPCHANWLQWSPLHRPMAAQRSTKKGVHHPDRRKHMASLTAWGMRETSWVM